MTDQRKRVSTHDLRYLQATSRRSAGSIRDDEFAADLSRVINGTAPEDYLKPALFFARTYPTRGIKELLNAVCLRLSGRGGEVSSILKARNSVRRR